MSAARRVIDRDAPRAEFSSLQIKVQLRNTPRLRDNGAGRERTFQPDHATVHLTGNRRATYVYVSGPAYRKNGTLGVAKGYASYSFDIESATARDEPTPPWLLRWLRESGIALTIAEARNIQEAPIEGDPS